MTERVLCIVSHPDDETMLTGGTLAMLTGGGAEVQLLCATHGEGGELGEPPVVRREALGATREQELYCAAQALGLAAVRFLDYVDPLVGEDNALYAYTDRVEELVDHITGDIRATRPTMLLTHGSNGEYGHPGHVLTHRAVVQAHARVREQGEHPALYTFCAAIPGREDRIFNDEDPADFVLDVTPWLAEKADAANCHRSQHGLFYRNHPEARSMEEVVRRMEAIHRVWPDEGPVPAILAPYRV